MNKWYETRLGPLSIIRVSGSQLSDTGFDTSDARLDGWNIVSNALLNGMEW